MDSNIQEMYDTLRNFTGKFDGWMTTIKIRYELIQGLSAVLPYDEDIIYESKPDKALDYECVDEFVLKSFIKLMA